MDRLNAVPPDRVKKLQRPYVVSLPNARITGTSSGQLSAFHNRDGTSNMYMTLNVYMTIMTNERMNLRLPKRQKPNLCLWTRGDPQSKNPVKPEGGRPMDHLYWR